ncbi:TPA_asm: UL40.6 sORF 1 [Human alphaherpesvirus 1]|nr:TPA_asm: UL40.6 sORF 1 [Human alphaherpesvirus 1]
MVSVERELVCSRRMARRV